jgi:Flp pilus assembly pilin Flp
MNSDRKTTIILGLLVVLASIEIIKIGVRVTTWFNQRFSTSLSK